MFLNFNIAKAIESVKLVLINLEDKTSDFHKLFKILYFAEQKHIVAYGIPIFNDSYIAMKNGPVPSNLYDIFKIMKGNAIFRLNNEVTFAKDFTIQDNYYIKLDKPSIDLEMFAETEIECLSEAIEENKLLDFSYLTKKSHDWAWKHTEINNSMPIFQIAKAGGANDEMIKYISLNIENSNMGL